MLPLLAQTVTVVHRDMGTNDDYGNAGLVETSRTTARARMWQEASKEATVGRDTAADDWRIILPAGTDFDANDRVEWDGRVFDVDGTPDRVFGPRQVHHVEASLHYSGPVT